MLSLTQIHTCEKILLPACTHTHTDDFSYHAHMCVQFIFYTCTHAHTGITCTHIHLHALASMTGCYLLYVCTHLCAHRCYPLYAHIAYTYRDIILGMYTPMYAHRNHLLYTFTQMHTQMCAHRFYLLQCIMQEDKVICDLTSVPFSNLILTSFYPSFHLLPCVSRICSKSFWRGTIFTHIQQGRLPSPYISAQMSPPQGGLPEHFTPSRIPCPMIVYFSPMIIPHFLPDTHLKL